MSRQIATDSNLPDIRALLAQVNPLVSPAFAKEDIYVANPPVDSSGDIYHIAAYLFLCQAMSWKMPTVLLTYDNDRTRTQVISRAQPFLHILGLNLYCEVRALSTNSKQARPRLSVLRKESMTEKRNTIDQKMTTALLACAMRYYGNKTVIEYLRRGFLGLEYTNKQEVGRIIPWALEQYAQISKTANGKPIIIISHRVSDTTNSQQSFSNADLVIAKQILETQGIHVHLLIVGGDKSKLAEMQKLFSPGNCKYYTDAFDPQVTQYKDHEKLQHIILLDQWLKLPNLIGMLGGTSGTLDIAAFLGWNVHNVHTFKAPDDIAQPGLLDIQAYRILLQTQFMSVGHPLSTDQGRAALLCWLDTRRRQFPTVQKMLSSTKTYHVERDAFQYVVVGNPQGLLSVVMAQTTGKVENYKVATYNKNARYDLTALTHNKNLHNKLNGQQKKYYKHNTDTMSAAFIARLSITTQKLRYSQDDCLNKTRQAQVDDVVVGRRKSFSL